MKYRKNPVIVEAVQFTGDNYKEIMEFGDETFTQPFFLVKDYSIEHVGGVLNDPTIFINTLEGKMKVSKGDFVVKGVEGEYYPCKEGIFLKTHRPAYKSVF